MLLEKFHEFYAEVLSVDRRMASGELTTRDARERLERLLMRLQLAAEREAGHYGVELFAPAKYAMAALADEFFLRPESAARDTWMGELLEAAVFKSQRAGEKLFHDIDELQSERGAGAADLARVYLAVLGLGFQGRFRDSRDAEAMLEEYRHKLYRMIFGRDPLSASEDDSKIVPRAYAATLDDSVSSELPYMRPWIWALAAIFVIWIVAAHLLWRSSIDSIEPLVEEILEVTSIVTDGGGQP